MIVILANKIHPRIRGCLKTWFIEPKTNVFISNINNQLANRIISMLQNHLQYSSGLLILQSTNNFLGYKIISIGNNNKIPHNICGLNLFE